MKIGVISDTHAQSVSDIPQAVLDTLAKVDLIVHAGDFTDIRVLEGLQSLGEVKAVHGNMDSTALRQELPEQQIFVAGGKRIGLTHGSGSRLDIVPRIRLDFIDVDIIIFGHSHEPYNRIIKGTLLFNPGPAMYSFGLLTIGDEVKSEIILLWGRIAIRP